MPCISLVFSREVNIKENVRNETSQIPVTGPGTCLVLVSIRPGRGTRPDESEASDSHARSSQTPAKFWLFFFWQRRTLDIVDFGQRGRILPLSTARNLDFGQCGLCHCVDFFSRNEWQQLFGKWAIDPDHYSVFLLLIHFPFEENHQIEITVNPENVNKTCAYDHDLDSADLQLHVVCLWIREGVHAPFFWRHTRLRLVTSGLTSFLLVTSASRVTSVWLVLVSFHVFS